ncbi:HNH endonuclease signature motif containing protein [Mycobacterium helveticum]|uniref:HNH endonuclease signature motif containing protein n=1 Tax=Mycobacterium helveticum TaxID=2592811 RepID=UPI00118EECE0|nr:HNH endonuclease signature motif containing protein [Mycobacterium helveticum]TVS84523.1 HNH endonuclease [Mycobacterium helveticum]
MNVDREELTAAFDALDADVDRLLGFDCDALTTREQLALLERVEKVRRRLPALEHPLINNLARQATPEELGGKLSHAIAGWTLVSRREAARRVREAADLGPRHGLTGEPVPPTLPETAARQKDGKLGAEHVTVIRAFSRQLPGWVDQLTRERAEADLAKLGSQHRPEELAKLADKLDNSINPDGTYTDADRAQRRGLILGAQGPDKMSQLRGWITPELRATLEALWAKLAAPGMCNNLDEQPCVDGTPSQDAIDRDTRGAAQRHHDGLLAALRAMLASGELGQHNGLPAAIIATTTLAELEAAAGHALTGGGTILPMSDVIRLARHSHHYLAIFDHGKALALYHTKRLASPAQRIVLYAKDRGCSAPGCTTGGYYCEVHHVTDWAQCHRTDIDDLTFGCGPHHRLLQPRGWTTRTNTRGETEWIPPPHLERGQPRTNTYWHPEKLLRNEEGDEP